MKIGHEFHPEHGFTGSAHPAKEFRPTMPGYKHGGEAMHHKHAKGEEYDTHPKHDAVHYDEQGYAHMKDGNSVHMKHGGKVKHMKHGGKDHMKHGGKTKYHHEEM